VQYALAQRPEARNVLLVSGGVGGTAREILKYPVNRIDYVELDPLILELGRKYLPANLADPRIHVINTDGRLFLKQKAARQEGQASRRPRGRLAGETAAPLTDQGYDLIILDLPAPATAQLNRFYTVEFLAEAKRALARNGVLSFSLGHYENYVSPELARLLASAYRTVKCSFPNILVIPGGRVFFLASEGPLFADIAGRLEQRQIKTKLVNRHYLEATLAPDRMADLVRAVAQPAALNKDLSPILYFYHLRHWMSQFNVHLGPLQGVLLLMLGFYLVRLRRSAFVLFASGFAASALEIVLLLAFQVLCGSVYHQVGLIVTVFMLGLALGAWLTTRARRRVPLFSSGLRTSDCAPKAGAKEGLWLLAAAIAAYALFLPLLLPGLDRLGGTAGLLLLVKTLIAGLTFVLAALVGMQFPLANQLESAATPASLSRLYTADFVGASLGALLACTLLIPLLGVPGVCLLTAAVNALAAVVMRAGERRVVG
jgi:spermidine synthase